MHTHRWIRATHRSSRQRLLAGLDLPPVLMAVDAHRRLRGPYSAAGAVVRAVVPDATARDPHLVRRYVIEITTAAPELADSLPPVRSGLEWTVADDERTRFYSRLHTLNVANGLSEFLHAYLQLLDDGPRCLVVDNAHHADPTDQEFLAVLLRRTDLDRLVVVVGTDNEPLVAPRGEQAVALGEVLPAHAEVTTDLDSPTGTGPADTGTYGPISGPAAAGAYVESDGTSDDPRLIAAYRSTPAAQRAALHDQRRHELAGRGEFSLALGAIPYHAEHGSEPATAGAQALLTAMDHCRKAGLYQAAAELGVRGRALVDPDLHAAQWWHFTEGASTSMASVNRADDAEAIYDEARARSVKPMVHLQLAYGTAMLYARHYPEDRRDYRRARAWMNLCLALASQLEEPKQRSFHSVFSRNGLALIEVREGHTAEALRLLEEAMAQLDRDLTDDEHVLHRSVLRYNRAQVFAMTGRHEEALADFLAVTALDPDFPEHHFNIGNTLRKLGRHTEALASYRKVLPLSPPFPEVHYNLADTHLTLGDTAGALAHFDRVLTLDPGHVEAHLNRGGLRCELGDLDGAESDALAGLAVAPQHPHLRCLRARILADRGHVQAARTTLDPVLTGPQPPAAAWALSGQLHHEAGEHAAAVDDLARALALDDDPQLRFNQAVALESAERFTEAAAGYEQVLAATDDPDVRERLELCQAAAERRTTTV